TRRFDLRGGLFFQNRAMGMGQPQAHGLGLLSDSAFPVERYPRALGFPGTSGDLRRAVWFGICRLTRRLVRRASGLRTHRARETRLCRRSDAAVADGSSLCYMADLQLSGLIASPQSRGGIPGSSLDGRI